MQSSKTIGVGTLDLSWREWWNVLKALKSKRLSYGPFCKQFEQEFAALHGAKYAIFVNSGTSALSIGMACLKELGNWQDGDEVIIPAVTFVATANIVLEHNLKPVFVDVDPKTYNLDPTKLEAAITSKTRAILPVHLFGQVANMDPIMEIAAKHDLRVMEDSCETIGAHYKNKMAGSFGEIGCFSTYIAHLIVTGVGGLAVTSDPKIAEILRSLANHGRDNIYISIDDDKNKNEVQFKEVINRRFKFIRRGYSFRATEFEAALGCAQLMRWQKILSKRQKNAHAIIKALAPFEQWLQLASYNQDKQSHAFMMLPIVIKQSAQCTKADLTHHLESNGIETRDMLPLINQPAYADMNIVQTDYPVADWINNNGFYIGCHQHITQSDIEHITKVFSEFFSNFSS